MNTEHNTKIIKCTCGYEYKLETDYNKDKGFKIKCPNCDKVLEYKKS